MKNQALYCIKKIISIRKRLIKEGKSFTNVAKNYAIIQRLEIWLNAFPNANEQQLCNFVKRNWHDVKYLIPGNKAGQSIFIELQQTTSHE
jgi:ribosomal 50S subunit-associated protein YjgA (DUF615 family)